MSSYSAFTAGSGGSQAWIDGPTWTYSSADGATGIFTIAGDYSAVLTPGTRLRLTQTTVKYFIVTVVAYSAGTTTVTCWGGTDYTLANAAISVNSYSYMKAPPGMNIDPAKWTVETSSTSACFKASPVSTTWYGDTGMSATGPNIIIPIGCWRVYYEAYLVAVRPGAAAQDAYATLSTASNSESDTSMTAIILGDDVLSIRVSVHKERSLTLAAKTTYYLNAKVTSGGASNIGFSGNLAPTIIRAVCAYL